MSRFWRTFLLWFVVLSTLWTFANLPRGSGIMAIHKEAGFPRVFAVGFGSEWQSFDIAALLADIVLGMGVALGLAGLCAWSRCCFGKDRTT